VERLRDARAEDRGANGLTVRAVEAGDEGVPEHRERGEQD
jgi:hypothetical protein